MRVRVIYISRRAIAIAVILGMAFGLFLRVGLVLWACNFCNEFVGEVYAISGFLFYVIYLVVVVRIVK